MSARFQATGRPTSTTSQEALKIIIWVTASSLNTSITAVCSVSLPPCGEASHPSLGQGVPPPPGESKRRRRRFCGVPPHTHSLSARFQATGWSTSPRVAARMRCHLLLHCRLVDFNLLTTEYSWLHRRARRALPVKALRRHPATGRRGMLLPAWGKTSHPCTRERRAATTGRLEAPPPTLPWRAAARAHFVRSTGRPTSPSVAASMKHHPRLHCPLVEYNLLVLTSVPDPIINVPALDHSRCNHQRLVTCSVIMWYPHCGTADPPVGGLGMDRGWTKHAVQPRRRGPVSTTRHEERQSHV